MVKNSYGDYEMSTDYTTKGLEKYFDLIEQNSGLVLPKDSPIRIITDKAKIKEWQAENLTSENHQIGVLIQDKYITVVRDLVEFPGGHIAGYNRIINTASLEKGGIGAVILPVKDGKVLLIRIFRHPIRRWSIEIPRGFGEPGLSPEEIAKKEILEEVSGEIKQVISLGFLNSNTGLEAGNVNLYLAYLDNVGEPQKSEGIEQILWVNVKELEKMIEEGQITDSFTIVAYTKAKIMGLLEPAR